MQIRLVMLRPIAFGHCIWSSPSRRQRSLRKIAARVPARVRPPLVKRAFVSLRSKSRDRWTRMVVQMQRRMVTPCPLLDPETYQNCHKWPRPVIVATTGDVPLVITFVAHRSRSRDRWTRTVAQMCVGCMVAGLRQALSHQPVTVQSTVAVFPQASS